MAVCMYVPSIEFLDGCMSIWMDRNIDSCMDGCYECALTFVFHSWVVAWPQPGARIASQTLRFKEPALVGDCLEAEAKVVNVSTTASPMTEKFLRYVEGIVSLMICVCTRECVFGLAHLLIV